MIKMFCDRCGEKIKGTTYYTISIYAEDINSKTEYSTYAETAIQNINTNMKILFNTKPQYCKKCRDEIEAFINNT